MKESLIENDGVKYAQARGWEVYKWSAPGRGGILDRLHFKKGIPFVIEYKSTGERATPKQRAEALKLKLSGIPCRCCDNVTDAREFIDTMTQVAAQDYPRLALTVLANDITSFDP